MTFVFRKSSLSWSETRDFSCGQNSRVVMEAYSYSVNGSGCQLCSLFSTCANNGGYTVERLCD